MHIILGAGVTQIWVGIMTVNTNAVQQFDTFCFEIMFYYNSEHLGALLAETRFNHCVAATTCDNHAWLVSMTNKLCIILCLDKY
jgi:hypothetical protein